MWEDKFSCLPDSLGLHDKLNKQVTSSSFFFPQFLATQPIEEEGTVLKFNTANHNVTGQKRDWRHYRGQCDYFAVYNEELNKVYLIPVDEVGTVQANLRLAPTKNNQEKFVRWARDYEV
jgi:hypothetical protein